MLFFSASLRLCGRKLSLLSCGIAASPWHGGPRSEEDEWVEFVFEYGVISRRDAEGFGWIDEKSCVQLQVAVWWGWRKRHGILLPCQEGHHRAEANDDTRELRLAVCVGGAVDDTG